MTIEKMDAWTKQATESHAFYVSRCMLERKYWKKFIDAVDAEAEELCAKKCSQLEGLFGYDRYTNHTQDYRMGVDFALIILENDNVLKGYVPATEWKSEDCINRLNFQIEHCCTPALHHTDTERVIQRAINDVLNIFVRNYRKEVMRIMETEW